MFKSIALVAFAILPSAALAASEPRPEVASRDGVRFEYVTKLSGDLVTIDGRTLDNGEDFHLVVAPNGNVTGSFGYAKVEYAIPRARRDRLVDELHAKTDVALAQTVAPSTN